MFLYYRLPPLPEELRLPPLELPPELLELPEDELREELSVE